MSNLRRGAASALAIAMAWMGATALMAQEAATDDAAPEIVLPPMVLDLRPPGPEEVEAGLPPAEELLPPDGSGPLPTLGELAVPLPAPQLSDGTPSPLPGAVATPAAGGAQPVQVSATLGAGSLSQLSASVDVLSWGVLPAYRLHFSHDAADGVRGVLPVGGGGQRGADRLSGELRTVLGPLDVVVDASAEATARGLQGQTAAGPDAFTELGTNTAHGGVHFDTAELWPVVFEASLAASSVGATLQGSSPASLNDVELAPRVGLQWATDQLRLGLEARYGLRVGTGTGQLEPATQQTDHGVAVAAEAVLHQPTYSLAAEVAWRWGTVGHRVPFHLAFDATPAPGLALSVSGGHRVGEHRLAAALALPYSRPLLLADSSQWYAEVAARIGLGGPLSLLAGTTLLVDDGEPINAGEITTGTFVGLFDIVQQQQLHITPSLAVSYVGSQFRAELSAAFELWDVAPYRPLATIAGDVTYRNAAGTIGAELSAEWSSVPSLAKVTSAALPLLSLEAFWQLAPSTRAIVGATDLLEPFVGERIALPTALSGYRDPGLRLFLQIQVSL